MAPQIPRTMQALAISRHCTPSDYHITTLPRPEIKEPDDILIKVGAASVNPIDVKTASSMGKMMGNNKFPQGIGYDVSGTVVAVGSSVTMFKEGDEVYSKVENRHGGTIAEYALCIEGGTALKPPSLTFVEAASVPLVSLTALQAFKLAEKKLGTLKGKTVFIPAGLSGTGSAAIFLAKNVFGVGKVVTTLSPGKILKVKEYLGDATPDHIVDYTKPNVNLVKEIGKGTVDFMFDTTASTISILPVMKKGGTVVSISTLPGGDDAKRDFPGMPFWLKYVLNLLDWMLRAWTDWKGVSYSYLMVRGETEGLDQLTEYLEAKKIVPIVGRIARLKDIEDVRAGCQQVFDTKGGVGKFVIEM